MGYSAQNIMEVCSAHTKVQVSVFDIVFKINGKPSKVDVKLIPSALSPNTFALSSW